MAIFFELPKNLYDGIGVYSHEIAKHFIKHSSFKFFNWHHNQVEDFNTNYYYPPLNNSSNRVLSLLRSTLGNKSLLNFLQRYQNKRIGRIIEATLPEDTLYYCPTFIPKTLKYRTVITIHDLSHLRYPKFHPPDRVEFLNKYLPNIIDRAELIITVSNFSKAEILNFFPKVNGNKIHIISNAARSMFKPLKINEVQQVIKKYKLNDKNYFFSLATIEPRKNIAGIIAAHRQLPTNIRKQFPLVLAGRYGWNNELVTDDFIITLGFVPNQDLSGLMNGASCFIYPSFYEGFGIPVVEAMSCKIPVITSDNTALREITAGLASLIEPTNTLELTNAMAEITKDKYPKDLVGKAYAHVLKSYSWQSSAKSLYKCLTDCR